MARLARYLGAIAWERVYRSQCCALIPHHAMTVLLYIGFQLLRAVASVVVVEHYRHIQGRGKLWTHIPLSQIGGCDYRDLQ